MDDLALILRIVPTWVYNVRRFSGGNYSSVPFILYILR